MASHQEDMEPTGEAFPIATPLNDPPERTPTTLSHKIFRQLCTQFGIAESDALLPGVNDTADRPPHGFVAVNRQMCLSGAIPPFNDCLRELLLRLSISPIQLHPNGYAILLGLCVLFRRTLDRFPSFGEIRYLCTFAKNKDHPSITVVRSARNRKLIIGLPDSVHSFLSQFFYVRCPPGFYTIWRVGSKITCLCFLCFFRTCRSPSCQVLTLPFSFQHLLLLLEIPVTKRLLRGLWRCRLRKGVSSFY